MREYRHSFVGVKLASGLPKCYFLNPNLKTFIYLLSRNPDNNVHKAPSFSLALEYILDYETYRMQGD